MSEKISRKLLKRPDKILRSLWEGFEWAEGHLKVLVFMGGGIFAVAAIVVGFSTFKTHKEHKALGSYYDALKAFEKKQADSKGKADPKEELEWLSSVGKTHQSSEAGYLAHMKLGEYYLAQNNFDKAIEAFLKAEKGASNQFYKVLVYYNLGYAYEMKGSFLEAIDSFKKITAFNTNRILFWSFGSRPDTFWLASAYFGIGRAYEKLEKGAEAKEAYFRVVDEFPNTPFADQAQGLALLVDSQKPQ